MDGYVGWSGLTQLDEVVSLDPMLCATVLPELKGEDWPHIVNEDFMLNFFVDLEFLLDEVSGIDDRNILCVYRNPTEPPPPCAGPMSFEFVGYDLVDVEASASALTNCGGFPDVFKNSELSSKGLLDVLLMLARFRCNRICVATFPEEHHANCHVWAIFRAA